MRRNSTNINPHTEGNTGARARVLRVAILISTVDSPRLLPRSERVNFLPCSANVHRSRYLSQLCDFGREYLRRSVAVGASCIIPLRFRNKSVSLSLSPSLAQITRALARDIK